MRNPRPRDGRHRSALLRHANAHDTFVDTVSRVVDDDYAVLGEAVLSAQRGKARAIYDVVERATGCGGHAMIVQRHAHQDALQDVVREGR